jgi:hypothetical protein
MTMGRFQWQRAFWGTASIFICLQVQPAIALCQFTRDGSPQDIEREVERQ